MQSGDSGDHSEAGGSPSRRCEALFKIDSAAARSIMLEGKISALQLELGASSREHFQMDTTRAVEGNLSTTRGSLEQGISEVQKAPDTLRLQAHPRGHHVCNETCSRSLQGIRTCPAWCEDALRANIMCRRCVFQRFEQSVEGQHNKHASEYA